MLSAKTYFSCFRLICVPSMSYGLFPPGGGVFPHMRVEMMRRLTPALLSCSGERRSVFFTVLCDVSCTQLICADAHSGTSHIRFLYFSVLEFPCRSLGNSPLFLLWDSVFVSAYFSLNPRPCFFFFFNVYLFLRERDRV